MPKKTRKEKLLAQQHRNTRSKRTHLTDQQPSPTQSATHYFLPSVSMIHHQTIPPTQDDTHELSFIKRDLLTTVMLAAIAVGIEFALYWRWEFHR